jgi:thioredoxin-related protein
MHQLPANVKLFIKYTLSRYKTNFTRQKCVILLFGNEHTFNLMKMKSIIAILFLCFQVLPAAVAEIQWVDIDQLEELQRKAPRKVIIDICTDWCGWCKKMDATTFKDLTVVDIINTSYYAVKFNAEQRRTIVFKGKTYNYVSSGQRGYQELAYEWCNKKMTYPSFVVLDESLNSIQVLSGYRNAAQMETILAYFSQNGHHTTPWSKWERTYVSRNNNNQVVPTSNTGRPEPNLNATPNRVMPNTLATPPAPARNTPPAAEPAAKKASPKPNTNTAPAPRPQPAEKKKTSGTRG